MAKTKTFVSYSNITGAGADRVFYRAAITPLKDAVLKDAGAVQTPLELATYLNGVADANTLYPVGETLSVTLLTDLQAKIQEVLDAADTGGYKAVFKVSMAPSTEFPGVGSFFVTVKTPAGKQRFEYVLAD